MAFWNDVGNFFGGTFGGNKDDEERKRQQQQQAQRQAQQQSQQNQPQVGFTPAIRTLQDFTPQNNIPTQNQQNSLASLVQNRPQPQLPKPQPKPAQPQPAQPQVQPNFNVQNRPLTMASTPIRQYDPHSDPRNRMGNNGQYDVSGMDDNYRGLVNKMINRGDDPTKLIQSYNDAAKSKAKSDWDNSFIGKMTAMPGAIAKTLIGGAQQGGGALGDIAVQGGGVVDYLGQRMRGVDADKAAQDVANRYGSVRNVIHNAQDVSGNKLEGTSGADEAGARIASGKGTVEDWTTLVSTAGNVGLSSLMVTPGTAGLGIGLRAVSRPVVGALARQDLRGLSPLAQQLQRIPGLEARNIVGNAGARTIGAEHPVSSEPNAPHISENSPITPAGESPAQKPSGISSPNRPEGANKATATQATA